MIIRDLIIETMPIAALAPRANNPRTHSKAQIRQIAESIRTFGWTNPILIDEERRIIAGHGRIEAAKLLGLSEAPVIRLADLSEAQKRAYVIADNKLAENAGWDEGLLRIELQGLLDLGPDLAFDIGVIGFETAEIDILLGDDPEEEDPADEPVKPKEGPPVSRLGDLWILGRHRLLCGDARSVEDRARLMAGEEAGLIFTDPPYNVRVDGHVCGLGGVRHAEFVMASGEMSKPKFTTFLQTSLDNLAAAARDGAIAFVCMDWRHMGELLAAGDAVFDTLKNLCVWRKSNGGMGSLYRSQHELVFVFKKGAAPHVNNVALGRHGRYRTNVWDYGGINTFASGRLDDLAMHPTVKPVRLVEDAIKDCSQRRDIVLDGFAGSGTTLIAAERAGRRGYGLELDPLYVDVIIRRFEKACGVKAVHAETGMTFEELRAARAGATATDAATAIDAVDRDGGSS